MSREKLLKDRLNEVAKKVTILEEKYFIEAEMNKETYEKFASRYKQEQAEITAEMEKCLVASSNHTDTIKKALEFACNLLNVWKTGNIRIKEKFQKLLFPEGLAYDRENRVFRTNTINSLIAEIARLSGDLLLKTKGLNPFLLGQSLFAGKKICVSNLFINDLGKISEYLETRNNKKRLK